MEGNYSKGKWRANGLHIMIEGKTSPGGQSFVQALPIWGDKDFVDVEGLANARLMAAAPDLLEALQLALSHLSGPTNEISSSEYKQIEKAIEKALKAPTDGK